MKSKKVLDPISEIEKIREKIKVKGIKISKNSMFLCVLTNYGCFIYKK